MTGLAAFTGRVIKESLMDRRIMVNALIVPSVAMLLIGFVIMTMAGTDVLKIGIVNDDQGLMNTTASSAIIQDLRGESNITLTYLSQDQLDTSFKDKEIDAAIIFGNTFTSDLITKKNASIRVISEGTSQAKTIAMTSTIMGAMAKAAGTMQKEPVKSPINVASERYYGNGLSAKEFAVASILGLISFALPALLAMTSVFRRKDPDGRHSPGSPGPLGRAIAYFCAFSLFGFVQVLTLTAYVVWYIDASFAGDVYAVAFVQLLVALAGVATGILIASLPVDALNAFMLLVPAVVLQMLFGGLMVPIARFPSYVRYLSDILPYTYAGDAMGNIVIRGFTLGDVWVDCVALFVIALAALALSYPGLKKSTETARPVKAKQPAA